jgi:hypothetical protein
VAPKSGTRGNFEAKAKNNFLLISGLEDEDDGLAGRQGFPPPPDDNPKDEKK